MSDRVGSCRIVSDSVELYQIVSDCVGLCLDRVGSCQIMLDLVCSCPFVSLCVTFTVLGVIYVSYVRFAFTAFSISRLAEKRALALYARFHSEGWSI